MKPEQVNELMRKRRSIYPKMLIDKPIPDEIIWELLENANYAPTHKLTQPWRFKVFTGDATTRFGQFVADTYKKNASPEGFKEVQYQKMLDNGMKSAAVVAICMQRDPKASLPEIEETNAVACAVQNIWLSGHAYGIGMFWSSPSLVYGEDMKAFLGLTEGQSCLGILYMGYHNAPELPTTRTDIQDKVAWFR